MIESSICGVGFPAETSVEFRVVRNRRRGKVIYEAKRRVEFDVMRNIRRPTDEELVFRIIALEGAVEEIKMPGIHSQFLFEIRISEVEAKPFERVIFS